MFFAVKHQRIAFFILIGLGWSLLWFSQKHHLDDFRDRIPLVFSFLFSLVPTLGLVASGLFLRTKMEEKKIAVLGSNHQIISAVLLTPVLCLTALGVQNELGVQEHLFGLLMGLFVLLYAFGEEIGWRGYMQEEFFAEKSKWLHFAVIGTGWWLWHWFFLRPGGDPKLIMWPLLILASAGIGEVAIKTRSVLICVALHALGNILFIYPIVANGLSQTEKLITLCICLVVWIPAVLKLSKEVTEIKTSN